MDMGYRIRNFCAIGLLTSCYSAQLSLTCFTLSHYGDTYFTHQ